MTAGPLSSTTVSINGTELAIDDNGNITRLEGSDITGAYKLPAQAIGFYAVLDAGNPNCLQDFQSPD